MNVKKFFQIHGRFPSQHEFRQIREYVIKNRLDLNNPKLTPDDKFVEACRLGDMALMESLLPNISSIDCSSRVPDPDNPAEPMYRPTALCIAAQANQLEVVAWLLKKGAKVDVRSYGNRTALLYAAESGNFDCMNLLIRNGATHFTYTDQQVESHFISYTIRQSITRRELSYVIPSEEVAGCVLDYLGLGGQRVRLIERLSPKPAHDHRPEKVVSPIWDPQPLEMPTLKPIRVSKRRDGPAPASSQGNANSTESGALSVLESSAHTPAAVTSPMMMAPTMSGNMMVPVMPGQPYMAPPHAQQQQPQPGPHQHQHQQQPQQQYSYPFQPPHGVQQGIAVGVPMMPPNTSGQPVAVPYPHPQYGVPPNYIMGPGGNVYMSPVQAPPTQMQYMPQQQ